MLFYADSPRRRMAQILGDLVFVAFCVASVWVSLQIYDHLMAFQEPSSNIGQSGDDLAGSLKDAGDAITGIPLVPDSAGDALKDGAVASSTMSDAGSTSAEAIPGLARWLAIGLGSMAVLLACAVHLPGRVRFVREATSGLKYVAGHEDVDIFALRALARQPLKALVDLSDDPAGDWREGDPDIVTRLAFLELRSCGLEPEKRLRG